MRQVVLYIKDNDGNYQQAEMFSDETITITSKIQDVKDISKVFTEFSQPFTIPASKENNKILQHWYNPNIDVSYDPTTLDLVTGFDNRIKRDALVEIDYSPFKAGKIDLRSVNLRDGKPFSYSIIFYGNTVSLGDAMGDDQLKTLNYLDDNYNHQYNSTNVRTGVRVGLSSQSIIYPLISHTKRFYYDSANSVAQFSGNLYRNSTSPSDNQGVSWLDLKPAIKCLNIIEAIESKYNITFTRDFFGTTPFSNLYLWLSRNKGAIGGEDDVLKTRIIGDWTYTSGGTNPFDVSGSLWTFSVVKNTNTFIGNLQITTSDLEPYTLKAIDIQNGNTLVEEENLIGNQTISVQFLNTGSHEIRFILESTTSISFNAALTVEETIFGPSGGTTTANYTVTGISTTEEIIITDNMPDMKNIDFLTGLFKMFNLTAYYINDISDANFGKIYVNTLDNYYADAINNTSGGSYDISSMIDVSNTNIDAPTIYSGIDFNYQEPSTLLAINHMEQFNDIFGNEKVRIPKINKSEIYTVELPFEHMKFERLFDDNKTSTSPYYTGTNDTYVTDILWGYSAEGEFNGSFTPKAQGAATNTLSTKLKDTNQEFNNKIKVGDIVRNLTDNTSASVTAVDSSDTLSLSNNIMASGESYMILGDYNQGNYEPVLTKPLVFYGVQETSIATAKCINWISSGGSALQDYFRPSNTNEDSYNKDNPLESGTTTSTSTNKLIQSGQNFTSTVQVNDIVLNTTDDTKSKVSSIDSNTQLTLTSDIMVSGETYVIYRPPSYTLNFDNEVDEWNLTDYDGDTNSLFKKFYKDYINDLFDVRKRIYKVKAYLSMEVIINLKLNDRLIINKQVFIINSIKTNMKTELSKLELLNVVDNQLPS